MVEAERTLPNGRGRLGLVSRNAATERFSVPTAQRRES
jgi:hypothetical protein